MVRRSRALVAIALVSVLAGCASVREGAGRLWPFGGRDDAERKAAEDGRVSILAIDQQLTADQTLAGTTVSIPEARAITAWPTGGGDLTNATGNIEAAASGVAWRRSVGAGGGARRPITATPVGGEGRLFLLDADGMVRAVRAADGSALWSKPVRAAERRRNRDSEAFGGGLALDGATLFAATGFGELIAFEAATGREIWRARTPSPLHAAPVAGAGRVFVVTNDSELYGFDASNGQEIWSFQAIAEPARMLASPNPALLNDVIVAPFASGEIVALLAANGRRLWGDALTRAGGLNSLSAINDIAGRPVISGGTVFAVSQSGVIAAVDLRSGNRLWARNLASVQTPLLAGEQIYVVTVDSELVALERSTGAVRWVSQLRRFENPDNRRDRVSWTGPLMANGKLVLAASTGEIAIVDPQTGTTERTLNGGAPFFIPPVAMDGAIYLLSANAQLVALR